MVSPLPREWIWHSLATGGGYTGSIFRILHEHIEGAPIQQHCLGGGKSTLQTVCHNWGDWLISLPIEGQISICFVTLIVTVYLFVYVVYINVFVAINLFEFEFELLSIFLSPATATRRQLKWWCKILRTLQLWCGHGESKIHLWWVNNAFVQHCVPVGNI